MGSSSDGEKVPAQVTVGDRLYADDVRTRCESDNARNAVMVEDWDKAVESFSLECESRVLGLNAFGHME